MREYLCKAKIRPTKGDPYKGVDIYTRKLEETTIVVPEFAKDDDSSWIGARGAVCYYRARDSVLGLVWDMVGRTTDLPEDVRMEGSEVVGVIRGAADWNRQHRALRRTKWRLCVPDVCVIRDMHGQDVNNLLAKSDRPAGLYIIHERFIAVHIPL